MEINGRTKVVGLFGDPVSHSLSPAMHNAAFREMGLNYCYLPFRVRQEALPAAIGSIKALGLRGVNVTAPHKEAVVPYLDQLSPEAEFLNAVNTIENTIDALKGYNTDVEGFLFLLDNLPLEAGWQEAALLLGAGGAAKAVALALSRKGVQFLIIANRTLSRGKELVSFVLEKGLFLPGQVEAVLLDRKVLSSHLVNSSLIINALSEDPFKLGYLPLLKLRSSALAVDLRYNPPETPFMKWAKEVGLRAVNGLDMLLGQGVKAFEIFTGKKAPVKVMKNALQLKISSG